MIRQFTLYTDEITGNQHCQMLNYPGDMAITLNLASQDMQHYTGKCIQQIAPHQAVVQPPVETETGAIERTPISASERVKQIDETIDKLLTERNKYKNTNG